MKDSVQRWSPSSEIVGTGDAPGRPRLRVHPSVSGTRAWIKRGLDVGFASVGGLFLSPLMVLIAGIIWLSDGRPILYRQIRTGLDGRRFTIIKFRTMTRDAETTAPVWAAANDRRCIRTGAWLRRSGLDELPQIWNVLRGEMSLIGPRPERPEFVRQFEGIQPEYRNRERVRAGLTGYAQVHGWRGDTDIGQRLRHDLYYIDHWSLALDLSILLSTLRRGWSQRSWDGVPR